MVLPRKDLLIIFSIVSYHGKMHEEKAATYNFMRLKYMKHDPLKVFADLYASQK